MFSIILAACSLLILINLASHTLVTFLVFNKFFLLVGKDFLSRSTSSRNVEEQSKVPSPPVLQQAINENEEKPGPSTIFYKKRYAVKLNLSTKFDNTMLP